MLEGIVVGWEGIEDVFIANLAMKKPFILVGRHGICKTKVSKEIAKIYQNETDSHFRFYDATKDDLISIAGIPIPEQLKKGKLAFSHHDRSILGSWIIVVDEISRANKENSNLWLEILEEHTCFGINLPYETFIATMNPDTYASTFQLDEALMDRFYAVIPVPDFQQAGADEFGKIIRLNFGNRKDGAGIAEIREKLEATRENYAKLVSEKQFFEAVVEFVSRFTEVLLSQKGGSTVGAVSSDDNFYISARKTIQMTDEILGICATQMALQNEALNKSIVEDSAYKALIYTICIPMQLEEAGIKQLFEQMKAILFQFNMSKADKIRIKLSGSQEKIYEFFMENYEDIQKHLKADEVEKLVGQLTRLAREKNKILDFFYCLSKMNGLEEWKRRVGSEIIVILEERLKNFFEKMVLNRRIASEGGAEKLEKMRDFIRSFRTLPFPEEATKFLLDEVASDPYGGERWPELETKFEQQFGDARIRG